MKKLLFITGLLFTTLMFSQTTTHNKVKVTGADLAVVTDTIVAMKDNGELVKTAIQVGGLGSSGLEAIDEGSGIGLVKIGRIDENYGNIGLNAVDLSMSWSPSSMTGATGTDSFATGLQTTASGNRSAALGDRSQATGQGSVAIGGQLSIASNTDAVAVGGTASGQNSLAGAAGIASGLRSVALGNNALAIGRYSTAFGNQTQAPSFTEIAIGTYNTIYSPLSATLFNVLDRLFVVGNGDGNGRSDALIILKNGLITAPSLTDGLISTEPTGQVLVTKGYVDNNYKLNSYTVATLPVGTVGDRAYVTDATAPSYLAIIVGGGAVVCPVFFDGTNWVAH